MVGVSTHPHPYHSPLTTHHPPLHPNPNRRVTPPRGSIACSRLMAASEGLPMPCSPRYVYVYPYPYPCPCPRLILTRTHALLTEVSGVSLVSVQGLTHAWLTEVRVPVPLPHPHLPLTSNPRPYPTPTLSPAPYPHTSHSHLTLTPHTHTSHSPLPGSLPLPLTLPS